jgi:type 1 glutamine amidotransferase
MRLVDESYFPPAPALDPTRVEVLATSEEVAVDGQHAAPQPMFWTYEVGKGRVYGCVLGHYNWTFDSPYFRLLLLRGVAWAAQEDPRRFDPVVLRGAAVRN